MSRLKTLIEDDMQENVFTLQDMERKIYKSFLTPFNAESHQFDAIEKRLDEDKVYDIIIRDIKMKKKNIKRKNKSPYSIKLNKNYYQTTSSGIQQTITPGIQADTGANVSATDNAKMIFNYKPIEPLLPIGVFASSITLYATASGFLKIVSDA